MKLLLLVIVLSVLASGPALAQTVIVVRHAEKADNGADPPLSEAGQARARALAQVVADAHPSHVFTSTLQRTQMTARLAAELHSVTIKQVGMEAGANSHVADIAARIRALPKEAVALVVGHSNTVPLIARALGFAAAADMPECEYDRLIVLDLSGDRTAAVVGRYGAPTTCG